MKKIILVAIGFSAFAYVSAQNGTERNNELKVNNVSNSQKKESSNLVGKVQRNDTRTAIHLNELKKTNNDDNRRIKSSVISKENSNVQLEKR